MGKERKTGCFQSKVTNYVSTKTRTKREYQTFCGLNSYFSLVSFSDLKLSNIQFINQPYQA